MKYLMIMIVLLIVVFGVYFRIMSISQKQEKIKVGFMAPLSGGDSSIGFSLLKGVELARKEFGVNIELVTEDSGCDKNKSANSIKKLIDQGVVAVIGEVCSSASLTALPVANQNKVVMISAASTSPKLSIENDYFFRTVPADNLQGKYAADLLIKSGIKKLAIVYSNEDYGISFNKVLKDSFEKQGGQIVLEVPFETNRTNFSKEVLSIENSGTQGVFVISNSVASSVSFLKLFSTTKTSIKLFGSEAMNDYAVLSDVGRAIDGMVITAVNSGNKGFKQSYRVEYGSDSGLYAAQGYDALKTIFLAWKKGARTGEEIKNYLPQIDFDGVSGQIKFDKFGDMVGNYEKLTVKNGKAEPNEN